MRTTTTFLAVALTTLSLGYLSSSASATTQQDLAGICDSARLTDLERRECRAQFKSATDDAKRMSVYRIFDERINGPAVEPKRG